jgi:hypothetical protein
LRLVATLTAFIVGGIGATAARWLGIHDSGLVIAFAVIGAGLQSIAFILLYLLRTRPKAPPVPFGEPVRFKRENNAGVPEV